MSSYWRTFAVHPVPIEFPLYRRLPSPKLHYSRWTMLVYVRVAINFNRRKKSNFSYFRYVNNQHFNTRSPTLTIYILFLSHLSFFQIHFGQQKPHGSNEIYRCSCMAKDDYCMRVRVCVGELKRNIENCLTIIESHTINKKENENCVSFLPDSFLLLLFRFYLEWVRENAMTVWVSACAWARSTGTEMVPISFSILINDDIGLMFECLLCRNCLMCIFYCSMCAVRNGKVRMLIHTHEGEINWNSIFLTLCVFYVNQQHSCSLNRICGHIFDRRWSWPPLW